MGFGNWDLQYHFQEITVNTFDIGLKRTRYWGITVVAPTAVSGVVLDGDKEIHAFEVPDGEMEHIELPSGVTINDHLVVTISAGDGNFTVWHGYQ